VVAVFNDRAAAERAADELAATGIDRDRIHITTKDDFASNAAYGNTMLTGREPHHHHHGGGISGFFRDLFHGGDDFRDNDETVYSESVQRGHVVLSVDADEAHLAEAQSILGRYDTVDVDRWRDSDIETTGERTIPVVEEELRVGKEQVRGGGVRVYTRVTERPVEAQVELREERVRVDRRPVDRAVTDADFNRADDVIEVTETVERPVVTKESRVVEEITVGKDVDTRTETIRDTVRRTDVDVERVEDTDKDVRKRRR